MVLTDGMLAPDTGRQAAIAAAWDNLVAAGPTLSRAERVAVIEAARLAWARGADGPAARTLVEDVGHWIALDAGGITAEAVATIELAGLDRLRYLEAVGVASRLANIDFYARGLGATVPEIPAGPDRPPTGAVHEAAALHDGWVPSTGPLQAITVLEALPSDAASFKALHEPFYVPFVHFMDGTYADALHRTQIEWVAARSSYLNECFY